MAGTGSSDRRLQLDLPVGPEAVRTAREAVGRLAGDTGDLSSSARLLVSELVTNSVRHASSTSGTIVLRAGADARRLRVEVEDPGAGFTPVHSPPTADDPRAGGYGLQLVERLASRWGVVVGERTRVWFEIDIAVHRRGAVA